MAEAFLFDFDGVMTDGVVRNDPAGRLALGLGIPKERTQAIFKTLWGPYINGTLKDADFWAATEAELHQAVAPEKRDIWISWKQVRLAPTMGDLVVELQDYGYPVGLLSNATPTTAADLRAHDAYKAFDFAVISSETNGLAKPDPEIFHHAMTYLPGVTLRDVVFVDDMPRNVESAKRLGMQTILAQNTEQIITDVRTLAELSL
jgi:putative hydrolase of the HAD superfamily